MASRLIPSSSLFTTAAVKGWGGMVTPQWESVGVPFHWGPFHGLWFLIVHKAFFQLQADLASGISATASIVLPITPSAPATQSSATPPPKCISGPIYLFFGLKRCFTKYMWLITRLWSTVGFFCLCVTILNSNLELYYIPVCFSP